MKTKTPAELAEMAYCVNHAARTGSMATSDKDRLIIPAWGFELVLTIDDTGTVEGYINDTAD